MLELTAQVAQLADSHAIKKKKQTQMSEVKVISPAHPLNACDKKCGAAATGTRWERSIEREGGVGWGG